MSSMGDVYRGMRKIGLSPDNGWIERAATQKGSRLQFGVMLSGCMVFDDLDRELATSRYFYNMDGVWKGVTN